MVFQSLKREGRYLAILFSHLLKNFFVVSIPQTGRPLFSPATSFGRSTIVSSFNPSNGKAAI